MTVQTLGYEVLLNYQRAVHQIVELAQIKEDGGDRELHHRVIYILLIPAHTVQLRLLFIMGQIHRKILITCGKLNFGGWTKPTLAFAQAKEAAEVVGQLLDGISGWEELRLEVQVGFC